MCNDCKHKVVCRYAETANKLNEQLNDIFTITCGEKETEPNKLNKSLVEKALNKDIWDQLSHKERNIIAEWINERQKEDLPVTAKMALDEAANKSNVVLKSIEQMHKEAIDKINEGFRRNGLPSIKW